MKTSDLGPYTAAPGYEEAVSLDADDPLSEYRRSFVHSDHETIYLNGNSLGRLPVATSELVDEVTARQWGDQLISSWNEGWWDLQIRLGDKLAPLIGARPGEVIISDSTSVNLYKLAMAVLSSSGRRRIVTDDLNFPSDIYILDHVTSFHGGELVVVPSDGIHGPVDGLAGAVDGSTALVSLSHTTYTSGYTYDVPAISQMAHDAGAMTLWDCSHSVGAMPIDLVAWGADLAVGCTYKYLNGGPGSPAFLYVRGDLIEVLPSPVPGWWAHASPFEFDRSFAPGPGIRKFHVGTMPILSLAAIEPGLDITLSAGMEAIRHKSVALTTYLIELCQEQLEPMGFRLASPTDPDRRGSHVALRHPMAWPVNRAMIEDVRVVPDFRQPDNLRLGLAPLYTRFVDVHTAVQRIRKVMIEGLHESHFDDEAIVT